MKEPIKLAVLISGNGSNLQSIINAIDAGELNAKILTVISNDRSARGLIRATKNGLHTWVIEHRDYAERERFDDVLQHYLESINPDYILLAGFMRILGPRFIQAFTDRILNIHPSLLPAYKGLNTYQRALDNGDLQHGVSIHLVTAELDGGPIILQADYPIEAGDGPAELRRKGQRLEQGMYPKVIRWLSDKTLTIADSQVFYQQEKLNAPLQHDS